MKQKREGEALTLGAVIVAAGKSSRMQGVDKQFLELEGVPVLIRSIRAFEELGFVREIAVVVREEEIPRTMEMARAFGLFKVKTICAGGTSRQQSVFNGVRTLSPECGFVAIHDGARPFIDPGAIAACVADAARCRAACAAVPVKDTIKLRGEDGCIEGTPPRERLFIAQTPQVFERSLYTAAMENALARGEDYTDDCQLVEALGHRVFLSEGSYLNFKITTPEDLILAQALAAGEIY